MSPDDLLHELLCLTSSEAAKLCAEVLTRLHPHAAQEFAKHLGPTTCRWVCEATGKRIDKEENSNV